MLQEVLGLQQVGRGVLWGIPRHHICDWADLGVWWYIVGVDLRRAALGICGDLDEVALVTVLVACTQTVRKRAEYVAWLYLSRLACSHAEAADCGYLRALANLLFFVAFFLLHESGRFFDLLSRSLVTVASSIVPFIGASATFYVASVTLLSP